VRITDRWVVIKLNLRKCDVGWVREFLTGQTESSSEKLSKQYHDEDEWGLEKKTAYKEDGIFFFS
jgi:hypothetical protein